MDLTTVADELYALTPDEFTKTRNERAKEAKTDDKALSDAIKKLDKPSAAAWVVNMLVRRQAEELSQVLELGAALRRAQENLDGAELRELNKQRRQLTAAVTSQARGVAHELGVRVSDSVAAQVEETLRAAMTDEGAAQAVRTGQLVEALSATGVGELDVSTAVAVPAAIGMTAKPVVRKRPKLTVVEEPSDSSDGPSESEEAERAFEDQRALEEARQAAEDAEAAATKAQKKLDKAQKRVAMLEARSLQLQGELDEVRRRASELEYELEAVDDELTSAEDKRDRTQEKQETARADADKAKDAVVQPKSK